MAVTFGVWHGVQGRSPGEILLTLASTGIELLLDATRADGLYCKRAREAAGRLC